MRACNYLVSSLATDARLTDMVKAMARDESYQAIINALKKDILPNDLPLSHPVHTLVNVWSGLSIYDDHLLVLDNSQIIIPSLKRP